MPLQFRDYVPQITGVLSLGYGIFATVWDFHTTDQGGKKKLSKAGRIGICCLIMLAIWNGKIDYDNRQENEKKSRERDAAQTKIAHDLAVTSTNVQTTIKSLDKTLEQAKIATETSRRVLGQVNKSLEPLSLLAEGNVEFYLDGQMIGSYADRTRGHEPIIGERPDESYYPNPALDSEASLASVLKKFDDIRVQFEDSHLSPQLEIRIHCNESVAGESDPRRVRAFRTRNQVFLNFKCVGAKAEVISALPKYKSISDLAGLTVRLYRDEWANGHIHSLSIEVGQPHRSGTRISASNFKPFHDPLVNASSDPRFNVGLSATAQIEKGYSNFVYRKVD
jgi:hypothetical protein